MKHLFILILSFSLFSQADAQKYSKILLVNGFLHIGNGETMQSALIGIENGQISIIKNAHAYSYDREEWDTIIELEGRHIYPGFVAPNSTLGLTEIDAVRATLDFDEVGIMNPHIRTQIAFNVESKVISTVRTNGVLMAQPCPQGGIISGTSSVMKLSGWNWEDATISANDGIHLHWPTSWSLWDIHREDKSESSENQYENRKREIYAFFEMADSYASENKNETIDLRLEAMRDCFKGKKRVFIHANELQQLNDVLDFTAHFDLKFPVIVGGYDAHLITRKLSDARMPVMLSNPHSLPNREDDDVDLPYKLPFLLKEGNVKFCIQNEGGMEAMNARNIPFLAGTAAAYGLSQEDAVSAISLWSCEILGIGEQYGSIEKGKSATLFVSDGNALDMRTNNLFIGLVDGNFISLDNTQSDLYKKYSKKYQNQ